MLIFSLITAVLILCGSWLQTNEKSETKKEVTKTSETEKVADKKVRLVYCLGKDGYSYGQAIAIMRLTESEQEILENGLKWKFETE